MTTKNNFLIASKKLLPLWLKESPYRFFVLKGGRGSGKSMATAQVLIAKAHTEKCRILCVREYQTNIKQSVHSLVKETIINSGLEEWFEIQENTIRSKVTGSDFIFTGLQNMPGIKSMNGIKYVWVEEAASIAKVMWEVLIPTIRTEGSKFYICYNPVDEDDYTHTFFGNSTLEDTCVININWHDNAYFPEVLEEERLKCFNHSLEDYHHIWEGECRTISDAQVFKGRYRVEDFEEGINRNRTYYYGCDWGFNDPTAAVRCYIEDDILYITHELYVRGITIEELPDLLTKAMPSEIYKWPLYCDQSMPSCILSLKRRGFSV